MTRPIDLIDMRDELAHWLAKSPLAAPFLGTRGLTDEALAELEICADAATLAYFMAFLIRTSELYLVTESMQQLCAVAAETLPEVAKLALHDAPSGVGLIYFEQPIVFITNDHGEVSAIEAVSWATASGSQVVQARARLNEKELNGKEEAIAALQKVLGEVDESIENFVINFYEARDLGTFHAQTSPEELTFYRGLPRLQFFGQVHLACGSDLGKYLEAASMVNGRHTTYGQGMVDSLKILFATWMLMKQTLVVVEPSHPSRAERRSAARHDRRLSPVNICHLRRVRNEGEHQHKSVEWTCSWLVRGHWRQQWFPSRQVHRPVWIAPHIKGPDGKPLRLAEKITVLER